MTISLHDATFVWAVLVPLVLWLANAVLRSHRGLPASSGSDVLLVLFSVDLTVLGLEDEIRAHISQEAGGQLGTVTGALLALSLLAWLVSCAFVEPRLVSGYDPRNRIFKMTLSRHALSICSWAVCVLLGSLHIVEIRSRLK
jgi:hypothetical protein